MDGYRYSKLTSPTNIRLLRLLPRGEDPNNIRCELFEYPLRHGLFHLYEAISYVWGSGQSPQSITVDDRSFYITRNLFAALHHLRDDKLPRILWVDAICINQKEDTAEKEHQIALMAEIYAKASRVVIWLGDADHNGDRALEAIRLIGQRSTDRSTAKPSKQEILQLGISKLLERPWFQRIWVLQEAAAARQILIKCGSTEISGHAFCVGLEAIRTSLNNSTIQATSLIVGAAFRSRHIEQRDHGKLLLDICSLGELVDMYHTHKAEILHDKIYALLGMCSDDLRLPGEASLEPNYQLDWKTLIQRLVKFLLGNKTSIDTWNGKEVAVIRSKGCILGKVLKAESNPGLGSNSQNIEVIFRDTCPKVGTVRSRLLQVSVLWTLRNSAKSIHYGDLVCFLEGSSEPSIVRLCKDYFIIIMIRAVLPERLLSGDCVIEKPEILQSTTFNREFLLVWDWGNFSATSQNSHHMWMQTHNLKAEHLKPGFESRLNSAISGCNAVAISGRVYRAEQELHRLSEDYVEEEPLSMRSEAMGELLLQMDKIEVDWIHGKALLTYAAMKGHSTVVGLLIGTGKANIETKVNEHGRTPLSFAAENGHEAIVEQLLEANADVDARDNKGGRTPLLWAAASGREAVVKLLLEHNADVNARDRIYTRTPLLWAAANGHEAVTNLLLLEAKADINVRDRIYSQTPLLWAARNGHEAIVRLLLKANADVDVKNRNGWTPLCLAVAKGYEDVVRLLLEASADVDTKDMRGRTPLSLAAGNGHEVVVRLLLEANANVGVKDENGWTPLCLSVAKGYEAVVELLVEASADVDARDMRGRTPLLWAAVNGHEAVVKLLLQAKANVDAKDRNGWTPLLYATEEGHREVIEILRSWSS